MQQKREIIFYEHYFPEFYAKQSTQVRHKITYVFKVIRTVERVPIKFLKHLEGTDGLYEVRVSVKTDAIRIFCCFDDGQLVVLFNAFQKKSAKTNKDQLNRALRLKEEYFNNK